MSTVQLARVFALGAGVVTALNATTSCSTDGDCEDSTLLQVVRAHDEIRMSPETCKANDFKTYPYLEVDFWGTNYAGWEKCGGQSQSPIDLNDRWCHTKKGQAIDQNYGRAETGPTLLNNGHALEIEENWGTLTTGNVTWNAGSFHFHHPSEHTVDGKAAAAEMHIVNSESGGALAVVGIFFDVGKKNECLAEAFSELTRAGCKRELKNFNLGRCFKEQLAGDYWYYSGSLTTPPCSEQVEWRVMKTRATISKCQLDLLKKTYTMNARPTQPLNGRKVTLYKVH